MNSKTAARAIQEVSKELVIEIALDSLLFQKLRATQPLRSFEKKITHLKLETFRNALELLLTVNVTVLMARLVGF